MILVVELGETEWFALNSETARPEFQSESFRDLVQWLVIRDEEYIVARNSEEPFEICFAAITGLVTA